MPRSRIESASSRNVSAGKSLRGCNAHGRIPFNGTCRTRSPGAPPGVGAGGDASAGVVGAGGVAGAGLEMTGVPPNSAPRPRPKAGLAMRAECRRAGALSILVPRPARWDGRTRKRINVTAEQRLQQLNDYVHLNPVRSKVIGQASERVDRSDGIAGGAGALRGREARKCGGEGGTDCGGGIEKVAVDGADSGNCSVPQCRRKKCRFPPELQS